MSLTGLLLAGGLSRRMGRDKATLIIEGCPLWQKQLELLRSVKPQAIFISARAVPGWARGEVQVVLDNPPSRGPLSGIAAALECLQTSHLLALAVDLPKMTSAHLLALMAMSGPGFGVVSFNQDQFEPLAAVYPKEAQAAAQRALASSDVSMQSFAHELSRLGLIRRYTPSAQERRLYRNVNTIEELESGEIPT